MAYSDFSTLLFIPMVFIGGYFLVNLLLAVINSSFAVTHKEQQVKHAALKLKLQNKAAKKPSDDELNEN